MNTFCTNCGTPNRPNSRFCRQCGQDLARQAKSTPSLMQRYGYQAIGGVVIMLLVGISGWWIGSRGIGTGAAPAATEPAGGVVIIDDAPTATVTPSESAATASPTAAGPTAIPTATETAEPLTIPGTNIELPHLDDETEVEIGQEAALEMEEEYGIYNDSVALQRVTRIGQQIVPHSDRPGLPFRFTLLDTDEVNAFALPGGFIYVTRGMLEFADATADDELAGVIGHEIAHIARRHGAKRIETLTATIAAAEVLLQRNPDLAQIYETEQAQIVQNLAGELLLRGWSRNQEFDADHFGTIYMMHAGYNPHAIIALFTRMEQAFPPGAAGRAERLLETHPPFPDRIERVEAVIQENEP